MKFVNWLTGKKSIICLVLLEVVREIQAVGTELGEWAYWPIVIKLLTAGAGGGLLHKFARTGFARKYIFGKGK